MIGYYVHHQGSGHLHRMLSVTEHLTTPVTVLSSLARPTGCRLPWVRLRRDDEGVDPRDVEAGGTLHWVPAHDDGLRERMAQIVDWVVRERPTLVVVDVSVEVALLARLTGTPVVVGAMPGDRSDRPHRTAYDLADLLVAPWPVDLAEQEWCAAWRGKAVHVGGISRFDGREVPERAAAPAGHERRALLLWGAGAGGLDADRLHELTGSTPGWRWELAGSVDAPLSGEEVWRALCRADVVVSHAGQNAVAELAAARVPAVVVADQRPFDEQQHTVRALRRGDVAVALDTWPDATRWPALLEEAVSLGGSGWRKWSTGDGAGRAAAAIERCAAAGRPRQAVATVLGR